MAWTTSACARARPTFAEQAAARLETGEIPLCRSSSISVCACQPVVFLALSAVTLGVLAPLLPTSFIAAVLLLTGIVARRVWRRSQPRQHRFHVAHAPTVAEAPTPSDFSASEIDLDAPPVQHPNWFDTRRNPPAHAANHDWADLMSRVNHELRTPLNAVIGFSEVMALEMFGPLGSERYQDYVRYIRESAGELLKSAEDTLALTALLTNSTPTCRHRPPARWSTPSPTPGASWSARRPAATFNSI